MDDHRYRTGEFLFFGAAKKGKYWLRYCRDFGIEPKGMLDNKEELQGSICDGVKIYAPDAVQTLSYQHIFITCKREQEVRQQLEELGVAPERIVTGNHNFLNHFLYHAAAHLQPLGDRREGTVVSGERSLIFDLQNGMVLGGVEEWTYRLAGALRENGYKGLYLTTQANVATVGDQTCPAHILDYQNHPAMQDRIALGVKTIIAHLPCTVLCNFPQSIFWSACIVKKLYPEQIQILAVQHSDDQVYYEAYCLWQKQIDRCFAVSSHIRDRQIFYGMDRGKTMQIDWHVPCEETLNRGWSGEGLPLQIGYAGRVTTISKRADLLVEAALRLREKNIPFRLHIAGAGEYAETLRQRVQEENMESCIYLEGYIDRSEIPVFWKRQDIMLSCSEREGHSISQSEAMAAGAVPVITDVSGARDDVTDGYNGFVAPVGDMDALIECICFLSSNRGKLEQMGRRAHDTIDKRQKDSNQTEFWKKILREVWQT